MAPFKLFVDIFRVETLHVSGSSADTGVGAMFRAVSEVELHIEVSAVVCGDDISGVTIGHFNVGVCGVTFGHFNVRHGRVIVRRKWR